MACSCKITQIIESVVPGDLCLDSNFLKLKSSWVFRKECLSDIYIFFFPKILLYVCISSVVILGGYSLILYAVGYSQLDIH